MNNVFTTMTKILQNPIVIHQPRETKLQTQSAHLFQEATRASIMNVIFLPAERPFCNDLSPLRTVLMFKAFKRRCSAGQGLGLKDIFSI